MSTKRALQGTDKRYLQVGEWRQGQKTDTRHIQMKSVSEV